MSLVTEVMKTDSILTIIAFAVVHLLFILCSRIRTYRELLMIFFHDKHWYRSEPLFSVEEEDEDEEEFDDDEDVDEDDDPDATVTMSSFPSEGTDQISSTSSHQTITSHQPEEQSKKTEYEFLLFNYLLRFVHREGDIGEYARAGLLFLMDVAMSPGEPENQPTVPDKPTAVDTVNDAALALAEYILDGDFSDVLGAGINAVYSLLPSKLGFFPSTKSTAADNGMTIGGVYLANEDERERILALLEKKKFLGMDDARSPEFQAKIDYFLTLLVFLQDVLRHNDSQDSGDASALVGAAIVQSILDAVRRIFLENVLYPSVLECSDFDGSAVAVMSYIDIMVRTLREGPLATLLVDFLMSEDNTDLKPKQSDQGKATSGSIQMSDDEKSKKNRRRQSSAMALLEMEAPESRKPSDYFTSMGRFTLKDLLISNLKSQDQETATSALQLLQTMLLYQPQLTTERILTVIPDSSATAFPHPVKLRSVGLSNTEDDDEDEEDFQYPGSKEKTHASSHPQFEEALLPPAYMTYSTHEREMDLYLGLVSHFDPSHSGDKETFSTGYDHYLRDALLAIQSQPAYLNAFENSKDDTPRFKHRLNVHDPVLSTILDALTTFFSNTPDFNVALTSILATLATHPDRSVAGWVTFALNDNQLAPASPYAEEYAGDGDDDRSIDFNIEEKLAHETNFLPAVAMDDNSRPVVYAILQALVNQLERYRHTIDNFDKFLTDRRQGLLFSENLSDALNLALDLTDEPRVVPTLPPTASHLSPAPAPIPTPASKPKPSTTSSFVSFLTPKKNKPPKVTPAEPSTPSKVDRPIEVVSTSPFGNHYHQTGSVKVDPFVVSLPANSQWSTSKSKDWNLPEAEDDVFGSAWGDKPQARPAEETEKDVAPATPLTLSQLLDNVVILEEAIKEIVAIIHARRSLGIDSLRYL